MLTDSVRSSKISTASPKSVESILLEQIGTTTAVEKPNLFDIILVDGGVEGPIVPLEDM